MRHNICDLDKSQFNEILLLQVEFNVIARLIILTYNNNLGDIWTATFDLKRSTGLSLDANRPNSRSCYWLLKYCHFIGYIVGSQLWKTLEKHLFYLIDKYFMMMMMMMRQWNLWLMTLWFITLLKSQARRHDCREKNVQSHWRFISFISIPLKCKF